MNYKCNYPKGFEDYIIFYINILLVFKFIPSYYNTITISTASFIGNYAGLSKI